tara:strand:- start:10489 stop:11985 length:1497 start_codon:yes stop_codon:yes gene_type:complete
MNQTKFWLLLTYVITAFTCFSSLYYFKYLPFSKSLSSLEHLRLDYFRQGGVWDDSYLDSPQAIAKNRLNLNAWGGFHEIKIDNFFKEDKLSLSYDVILSENSYIYLYLDRSNEENAIGIRLSLNKEYPSIFFRRNGKGKFLEKKALQVEGKLGRNKFEAQFNNPNIQININDSKALSFSSKEHFEDELLFAWGGSSEVTPVSVDNIKILNGAGQLIYENDFSLKFEHFEGIDIAVVIGIMLFIIVSTQLIKDEKLKLTASICFLLFFIQSGLLYRFYLSAEYIEGEEDGVTKAQIRTMMKNKIDKFEFESARNTQKIFFYGGSKTVGVGAREKEETWVKLLEAKESLKNWRLYNFGTISADSSDFIYLHERLKHHQPELIVILSGVNDHDSKEYFQNMRKLTQGSPIQKFLLIQESTYLDDFSAIEQKNTYRNFNKLKPICEFDNVECLRVDDKLYKSKESLYDSGILWVEWIHSNSYGQEVLFEIVADVLDRKVRAL